jgi:hypothetical protein
MGVDIGLKLLQHLRNRLLNFLSTRQPSPFAHDLGVVTRFQNCSETIATAANPRLHAPEQGPFPKIELRLKKGWLVGDDEVAHATCHAGSVRIATLWRTIAAIGGNGGTSRP